jgi:hypothetical protein
MRIRDTHLHTTAVHQVNTPLLSEPPLEAEFELFQVAQRLLRLRVAFRDGEPFGFLAASRTSLHVVFAFVVSHRKVTRHADRDNTKKIRSVIFPIYSLQTTGKVIRYQSFLRPDSAPTGR